MRTIEIQVERHITPEEREEQLFALFERYKDRLKDDKCFVYIGYGFSVGIGWSSNKLKIVETANTHICTPPDTFPTQEEAERALVYLGKAYPTLQYTEGYEVDE